MGAAVDSRPRPALVWRPSRRHDRICISSSHAYSVSSRGWARCPPAPSHIPEFSRHAAAGGWIMLDARAGARALAAVAATLVVLVLAPASARSSGAAGTGSRVDAAAGDSALANGELLIK